MKNLLLELDHTFVLSETDMWTPHTSNIYKITYSWPSGTSNQTSYGIGNWGWGPYGLAGSAAIVRSERDRIIKAGSIIVDEFPYTSVDTYADLSIIDRSFYFDTETQVLYVHFFQDKAPWEFEYIVLGAATGYAQKSAYYDGLFYDSRIITGPNLLYEKDPLIYGKLSIDTFDVQMDNTDQFFDNLPKVYPFGNAIRIYYGDFDNVSLDDFDQVFSGFFDSFSLEGSVCTIVGSDERKRLSVDLAGAELTTAVYPNLPDGEHYKPIIYGTVRNMPVVPLDDENRDLSSYRFSFYDRDYHSNNATVHNVYVDGVLLSPANYSTTTAGILTISNTYYKVGNDVTMDVTGSTIVNPLSIIEDLLLQFIGYEYNEFYYNQVEWSDARSRVVDEIQFLIIEPKEMFNAIEEICNTVFGSFVAWPDGRFSFKLRSETAVKTIFPWDVLSFNKSYNQDEYLTGLRILYDKDYANDEYNTYTHAPRRLELAALYNRQNTIDIETNIKNKADAITSAENIYDEFAGIFLTATLQLFIDDIDLYVGDVVDVYLAVLNNGEYGAMRGEVLSIGYDFNTQTYNISVRYIEWLFDYANQFDRFIRSEEIRQPKPMEI